MVIIIIFPTQGHDWKLSERKRGGKPDKQASKRRAGPAEVAEREKVSKHSQVRGIRTDTGNRRDTQTSHRL